MNTVNFSKSYVCYACLEVGWESTFVFCRWLDERCRWDSRSAVDEFFDFSCDLYRNVNAPTTSFAVGR